MEILLPILALGGYYVIENQRSKKKEKFKQRQPLDTEQFNNDNDTLKFESQIRYENAAALGNRVGPVMYHTNNTINSSLTEYADSPEVKDNVMPYLIQDMEHSNMNPLNGGKPRGANYGVDNSESRFDNYVGNISQKVPFKRGDQPPLFKPQPNVSWVNGSPNTSDYQQDIQIQYASKINNNALPFNQVQVGPALGEGYTSQGEGGFNSGLLARDLYMDKSVDELRTVNNPKVSTQIVGLEGPGKAYVPMSSDIKQNGLENYDTKRLDSTHLNSFDEMPAASSVQPAPAMHPDYVELGNGRGNKSMTDYFGALGGGQTHGPFLHSQHEESHRRVDLVPSSQYMVPSINANSLTSNNSISSREPRVQEENTFMQTIGMGAGSAVSAFFAPLTDVLRHTRKEDLVENGRIFGSINGGGYSTYARVETDKGRQTQKDNGEINRQGVAAINSGTYMFNKNAYLMDKVMNRDETGETNWFGSATSQRTDGVMNYGAEVVNPLKNDNLRASESFTPGMNAMFYSPVIGENTRRVK